MRVQLGPEAAAELEEATAWYLERGWDLADRFVNEVERTAGLVVENPRAWTEIEAGIRRALLRDFPYSLIYSVEGGHDLRACRDAPEATTRLLARPAMTGAVVPYPQPGWRNWQTRGT